jgi:hypothetical protein
MALFDVFRRRTIIDLASLGAFIDEQATLLAQQTVGDYSQLRAGPDPKVLLADGAIRTALELARFEAYPLALAMVGEATDWVLRSHAGTNEQAVVAGLRKLILAVFDRKGVPRLVGEPAWGAARQEISSSLGELADRPGKPVEAIVEAFAGMFLALMPLHERLGGDDFPALRNALKTTLGDIRDKLVRRADLPVVAAALAANAP